MAHKPHTAAAFLSYQDAGADTEFTIPADLSALDDEALSTLADSATSAFDALYGDGTGLSSEDLATLSDLTEGIEAIQAETTLRAEAAAEREAAAEALAARVRPAKALSAETEEAGEAAVEGDVEETPEETSEAEEAAEVVVASGGEPERTSVRIPMARLRSRSPRQAQVVEETGHSQVLFAADAPTVGTDFLSLAKTLDRRLATFNSQAYRQAAAASRAVREQHGLAIVRKPFSADVTVTSQDRESVERAFSAAVDQSRLQGGSLVASGGWCAPSETAYDMLELETRSGLISLPEINVPRGGLSWTTGPDFSAIFAGVGWDYSEQNDIDGEYGVDAAGIGNGTEGDKPCYTVPCPEFTEQRLRVAGLCISAGLLQARGYPEVIARVLRGALVAHDHKMAFRKIAAIATGSTPVVFPTPQVGAAAPILTAVEVQAQHYRNLHRLSENAVLEAIFPTWVFGVIRADLARRLGVDLLDVPDARIRSWFTSRGINPQFIYNWQDLGTTPAQSAVAYPTSVQFALYAAGTWVVGTQDILTLDSIYDSTLLGSNDFTALFTEEGYAVFKRGVDSRLITVPITADGATHGGVDIEHNGTLAPVAEAE